jgi:hypothetical protein
MEFKFGIGLSTILKIVCRTFRYRHDPQGKTYVGVIAQELPEELRPFMLIRGPDWEADPDDPIPNHAGEEQDPGHLWLVDSSCLPFITIKAVQELAGRMDAQGSIDSDAQSKLDTVKADLEASFLEKLTEQSANLEMQLSRIQEQIDAARRAPLTSRSTIEMLERVKSKVSERQSQRVSRRTKTASLPEFIQIKFAQTHQWPRSKCDALERALLDEEVYSVDALSMVAPEVIDAIVKTAELKKTTSAQLRTEISKLSTLSNTDLTGVVAPNGYHYSRKCGRGAFATTYDVVTGKDDGRHIARKVIEGETQSTNLKEAVMSLNLKDLSHPHVVKFINVGMGGSSLPPDRKDCIWVDMELVSGCSLRQHLEQTSSGGKSGGLVAGETMQWLCQLLDGVSYINAQGFIHRDLKPDNLMLDTATQTLKIVGECSPSAPSPRNSAFDLLSHSSGSRFRFRHRLSFQCSSPVTAVPSRHLQLHEP